MTQPNLSNTLRVLEQQILEGSLVQAATTRDEIGKALQWLYQAAEKTGEPAKMALISDAWSRTCALYDVAQQSHLLAAGAMTAAIAAKTDRDALAEQLSEIEEAVHVLIEYGSSEHPLMAGVEQAIAESVMEQGIHIVSPAATALENGWYDYQLEGSAADAVAEALFLSRADCLPHDLALELAEFLNQWGAKYHDWVDTVNAEISLDDEDELVF